MSEKVKLYVYQLIGEKTYIESFEQETFDDFVVVTGNFTDTEADMLNELHEQVRKATGKTVLLVDKDSELAFHGFRETEEDND